MTDPNPQDDDTTAAALLAHARSVHEDYARRFRALEDRLTRGEASPAERAAAEQDLAELLRAARGAYAELVAAAEEREPVQAVTLAELADLHAYWERVAEQRQAAPVGLGGLDSALGGGLQPRRLVVLLGAPGGGKTTLANQIAEHVADSGRPVVYLTTEDPPAALLAKTVARLGGLDYDAVLQGHQSQRERINAALRAVGERRSAARLLYVEETGRITLDALEQVARAHFAQYADAGAGLLVVDYLQRWARAHRVASGQREELREAVGRLTEDLRGVARRLNCGVLALASMNRASGYGAGKNGETSALASAKESGDIEFTADVVMAIAEPSEKQRERWNVPLHQEPRILRVDKNRQGRVTSNAPIRLHWYPARQTFTEAGVAE